MLSLENFRSISSDLSGYFLYLLLVSTLGPFLFGYHLSELNAPQDIITCTRKSTNFSRTSFGLPQCIPMNPTQLGVVSSFFTLGGLFGALVGGPLSARYGRLLTMRCATLFLALGPVAEALAANIGTLTLGRLVSGVGAGAALVVVPIYISEIAPPGRRGFFGAFTQIMTNTGILSTQVLGLFLSHGQMWRVILVVGGAVAVLQFVGLTVAVESPKYQADHGNAKGAKEDLRRIRGRTTEIQAEVDGWGIQSDDTIGEERQTLLEGDDHVEARTADTAEPGQSKRKNLGILEVLIHPDYSKAVIAVIMVMLSQQFTGINSIIMYGVSLLADLLQSNSVLLNVFVSLLNLVVTFSCAPLADILGRKPCIMTSIAGMGTASILLGLGIRNSVPVLSAVAVLAFVAAFAFGLGPVPYILASELVDAEAVGATQSWALAANWIATFIVAQFFPMANEKLGKGTIYFIFAGLAVFFFLFVGWWVPETMGKKDADEVWGRQGRRED